MKDCKIIQDLLPNYIEELTNKETNTYIEEHLKVCNECKKVLQNMKNELKVDNEKRNQREVKYIKKFNNRLKILKVTIAIILVIALAVMTHYYVTFKNAYFKASNIMVEIVKDGENMKPVYNTTINP